MNLTTSLAGEPPAKLETAKAGGRETAPGTLTKAKSQETIPGATVQPASYFFTGKPYDDDLGGYVFNYRNYSPNTARWTTSDPSGFPDGPNNHLYAPIPTIELDKNGLKAVLWIYCFAVSNAGAGSIDDTSWRDFQTRQDMWKQKFVNLDTRSPYPNYLSDGDHFDTFSISSIAQLAELNQNAELQIYIAAHGLNIGSAGQPKFRDPAEFVIGGSSYTEAVIKSYNSSIQMVLGCGSATFDGNITTTNSVAWQFGPPTAKFLKDQSE